MKEQGKDPYGPELFLKEWKKIKRNEMNKKQLIVGWGRGEKYYAFNY
ncbi:MAG: hypothetical protein ISS47_05265 [Candidatus Omnitrophica bacterium]|nr:hypothetical protein [Candidatus Omnitrophota bacterium]